MVLFTLLGILRGFPDAVYRPMPSCPVNGDRKTLCGLDPDKNCSFLI